MNKIFACLLLFCILSYRANAQYAQVKHLQEQVPDALMPFSLVPQCAIQHEENILLAGKITLGRDEDLMPGEEKDYGRYRAGMLCLDKNFRIKWNIHFRDMGHRREIKQMIPKNDSSVYVIISGKPGKNGYENCVLKTISYTGKELGSVDITKDRNTRFLLRPDGKWLLASTGHENHLGVASSFVLLKLLDVDFKPLRERKTYIGKRGNSGVVNDVIQTNNGYLMAASIGPYEQFSSSLLYADENLVIQKHLYLFEHRNTEADVVFQDSNGTTWLGCNATAKDQPSQGLALVKINSDFTAACTQHWGESKHNDVINILEEKERLLIVHEAWNDRIEDHAGHLTKYSGMTVFDKNCGVMTSKRFRKNINENTVWLLPYNGHYLLISRTEASYENKEPYALETYYGIRLRILNADMTVTKEYELGNF